MCVSMKSVKLNNKCFTPSKIICIGRNYVEHIEELGNEVPEELVVFLKPNSAISEQLQSFHQEALHYEAELCFLYQKNTGEQGKFIGVAVGLDLTKRNLQAKLKTKGLPWERAKAFNGAAVFSEFKAIDSISDDLSIELSINDVITQAGGVALMMVKPDDILIQLNSFLDLEDGDIVMTGTPKGVGQIKSGSKFSAKVLSHGEELICASWIAN